MANYTISAGEVLSAGVIYGSDGLPCGTVQANDHVTVLSGGLVTDETIGQDGLIEVRYGGSATQVTVSGGLLGYDGATLVNDTAAAGGLIGQLGKSITIYGIVVQSGGAFSEAEFGLQEYLQSDGRAAYSWLSYLDEEFSGQSGYFGTASYPGQTSDSTLSGGTATPIAIENGAYIGTTLSNATLTSTYVSGVTTAIFTAGNVTETVSYFGSDTFTSLGNGAYEVTSVAATCFAEGTNILTPEGERPVETIREGDLVTVLRDGAAVQEPVKWIGYSRINLAHHARPELSAPIRVKQGALGDNTPTRDIVLSPEHCLLLAGKCVPVKLLVNGGSIVRELPEHPFTYYHIELDRHGMLLAEGAASESYLDTGNRDSFDNAGTARRLHPTFAVNPSSERWQTDACAPLAKVPEDVAPIWQGLAERSDRLGFAAPAPMLVEDPDVHLLVDGRRVGPVMERQGRAVFAVPAGARSVVLASRFCIPSDKRVPGMRDTRRLGISVHAIIVRTQTRETVFTSDHPGLRVGWHAVENDGVTTWRWTDGAAAIPWAGIEGSAMLTVRFAPVAGYPVYDEKLRLVA
ncbi:MAG TPA: Hint domain-containing protein [Rhodopila sp.]|uniref:Hint domain-containing protein n=1 Tax=Rhodopila sp. TaxID=2480087 RepID=UPI002B609AAB|nr:Hint domain-containing protein [Rhodopila sp.]HVY17483.1 Hint domain-containing protein [Rhodopila sp.]